MLRHDHVDYHSGNLHDTTDVEPSMIRDATMFSTLLATTTATSQTDTDDRSAEGSKLLTHVDDTTLSTTTLAISTTKKIDEERIGSFVSRIFDKNQQHAKSAMGSDGSSASSVNDELKPSEVLKRLHVLGLLDDDD